MILSYGKKRILPTMNRTMPLRLQKYMNNKNTKTKPHATTRTPPNKCFFSFQPFGFVIVRCIRDKLTSRYWYKSYQSIRRLYPQAPIVIIDDNSNPLLLNHKIESQLTHCQIIQSEYPGCGEILGFYYFLKHRWFQKAIILHDSVFIRHPSDFQSCGPVRFIWHIETKGFDDIEWETELLTKIGGPYLDVYENKDTWKGCFGVMAVIDHDFLVKIADMFKVIGEIKTRRHRSCMERIFAVMCFHHCPELLSHPSVMGDIHAYPLAWGYQYTQYEREERKRDFPAFVKVWTGR